MKVDSRANWHDVVLFRDYLRHNKRAREEYSVLKKHLAKQFAEDRAVYTKAKEKVIKKIIRQAQRQCGGVLR